MKASVVLTGNRFPRRNRLGSSCSSRMLVSGYGFAVGSWRLDSRAWARNGAWFAVGRFAVCGLALVVRGMSWFLALPSDGTYMTYRTYMDREANCKRHAGGTSSCSSRYSGDCRDGCQGEPKALPRPIRTARDHHSRTRTTTSTKDDCRALSNLARAPRTSGSSSLPMLGGDDLQPSRCN